MRYKDELRIAGVTALFCCAMLMITAVVPKDTTVAKARKTFKEAPETAADAEAQAQSEAEDAGFTVYTEDSNYDYEDNSYDDSGSDDTSTDTSDSDSSGDTTYDPSYDDSTTDNTEDNVIEDDSSGDYDTSDTDTSDSDDGTEQSLIILQRKKHSRLIMLTPVTIPAQTFIQITTGSYFDANKGAVGK